MATTKRDKRRPTTRQLQFVCLLLPLAMMLPKGIDAYLHCDQTVDFFTADLAASVALTLAEILLLIIDCIYSKHGPRGETPSKRRIAYSVFQIIMALAIFGTGIFGFVGNLGSAISNGGAAEATTDNVVQRSLKDSWRMDPFDICNANDQGRILEVFRQQPEVHLSTHRAATVVETILAVGWIAVAFGLPFVHFIVWRMTQDEHDITNSGDGLNQDEDFGPEQNAVDLEIDCLTFPRHGGGTCSIICLPLPCCCI